MSITKGTTATTYWVCTDCYLTQEGDTESWEILGYQPDREPLNLIPEDAVVTEGLVWGEHDDDCPNRLAQEWLGDCGCERREFSRSRCDGCGSHLAGAREALTVWTKEE